MKIKLGVDVNITRSRCNYNYCVFCKGVISKWGVSVGSRSDINHENCWLHVRCIEPLMEFINKYNLDEVTRIEFLNKGVTLDRCSSYCSQCGREVKNTLMVSLRKNYLRDGRTRIPMHIHLDCLNKLVEKSKAVDVEEIENRILLEDL